MDIHTEKNGMAFVWNAKKAAANVKKHDGVTFEQAMDVFFDPFVRLVEADRHEEAMGYDASYRLLFVVHIEQWGESIRIISARKATREETRFYDS
ncbi:MAG TPA: hypothetical protein DCS21_08850 [Gammaproteobacteria bacterium]|nr:hypothetical protein [Gammaproteobacteria bacterium]